MAPASSSPSERQPLLPHSPQSPCRTGRRATPPPAIHNLDPARLSSPASTLIATSLPSEPGPKPGPDSESDPETDPDPDPDPPTPAEDQPRRARRGSQIAAAAVAGALHPSQTIAPAPTADADIDAAPGPDSPSDAPPTTSARTPTHWVLLTIASGACAACNGVFAKLTTTALTTGLAQGVARMLGLDGVERGVELVVRAGFFALNLGFNGVMWTLFTQALGRSSSATKVAIINTSTNFMLTALLSSVIFAEALPPLWWLGAALLAAGNLVIGRRTDDQEGEERQEPTTQQPAPI